MPTNEDNETVANGQRLRQVEPFRVLFDIIEQLETAKISYTVSKYRYDAVSILAHLPGERWEIDVMEDGEVDFERFVSNGEVVERSVLDECIQRFAD